MDRLVKRCVAVVDLGTTSTRLVIIGPGIEIRETEITRTGEGLGRSGRISDEAMGRVRACLARYRATIDAVIAGGTPVDAVRVVATSVARDAANRSDFSAMVESVMGVAPETLSGEEEGRLAFAGAVQGLDHLGVVLVVDIGGGSTDFAIGTTGDGLEHVHSVDTGASRVLETFLESDPPQAAELSAALSVIQIHLDDIRRELLGLADALSSSGLVIGVGGTITTVAAVEIGLIDYDREQVHGFTLTRDAVEDVFRTLATETVADRRHNPGLHHDRAELIVGGACILVETMRHFELDRVIVSEADVLDGVVAELMER